MIGDPPESVGADHDKVAELGEMESTRRLCGADGTSATTTELLLVAVLAPTLLTERTRKTYVRPVVKPGTVRLVAVDAAWLIDVQETPASVEYCWV